MPTSSEVTQSKLGNARRFLTVSALVMASVGTSGAVSLTEAAELRSQPAPVGTVPAGSTIGERNDVPAVLRRIRRRADLTWGEIASALGVTRRTIHHWLGGARIAPRHQVALANFDQRIVATPGTTAASRRAALTQPLPTGRSVLDDLALSTRASRRVSLSSVPLAAQLGESTQVQPEDLQTPDRRHRLGGRAMPKRKPPVE